MKTNSQLNYVVNWLVKSSLSKNAYIVISITYIFLKLHFYNKLFINKYPSIIIIIQQNHLTFCSIEIFNTKLNLLLNINKAKKNFFITKFNFQLVKYVLWKVWPIHVFEKRKLSKHNENKNTRKILFDICLFEMII